MKKSFIEIESIIKSKMPFVVYRKPNENKVTLIVQKTKELIELDDFDKSGFVFSPFDKKESKILFPLNESELYSLDDRDLDMEDTASDSFETKPISNLEEAKKKHIKLVEKSIDFIDSKKADKIVVSRKESLESNNFNVLNSYKKMLQNYKNAMVYLWFHPKVGCWMGASPERLIHVNNGMFKTMALAGTQTIVESDDVIWKPKEKQEQQFVTDYILETIKNTIQNVEVSMPYTIKAGNLLHIRTDVIGSLKDENSLEELISSLHPTPAVCGLPKKVATTFIDENEGYNREFYAGYLGELNMSNETNLFVNLRCMQVFEYRISIYIGGGITKDSNADKEWEETVFKAEVMKKIL